MHLNLVCDDDNDLLEILPDGNVRWRQYTDARRAIEEAPREAGVLILADAYPDQPTVVEADLLRLAAAKGLRLYIEFPAALPQLAVGPVRQARWERAVVSSRTFEPELDRLQILVLHSCHWVDIQAPSAYLSLARVAGFTTAVYGLPQERYPLLFELPGGNLLVATSKLSQCVSGRYAGAVAWGAVWRWILRWVCPQASIPPLQWRPTVRPSYGRDSALPAEAEQRAFARGVQWFSAARLFIHPSWAATAQRRLDEFPDGTGPGPEKHWPVGDGSCGMIEGASSTIHSDGTQDWRYHVRNDCVGEVAMAQAFARGLANDEVAGARAAKLNDFIYFDSVFAQGPRADPESPSYGLLSWTTQPPADGTYYGDDNARSMLGTMAVAALLGSDRWDESLLRCLLANLRTTGPQGFRNGSLREPELQAKGWRHFWETGRVHCAPHYESWLWAGFLWAYRHTGIRAFYQRALSGIEHTMEAYPDQWRWTNGIQQERARMLLPLAWLVRLEDTPRHRDWLRSMAGELLRGQDASGAIAEEVGSSGHGRYGPPASNQAYGTAEAPLIQQNGDPLCDLLYTANFAFVGLHEAVMATGDPLCATAADKLAQFFCRIQICAETHPELDGGWFRAFDFKAWDYWASNADIGWGAWSIESGWTQAWISSVLGLRQLRTGLWDLTGSTQIARHADPLRAAMLGGVDGAAHRS